MYTSIYTHMTYESYVIVCIHIYIYIYVYTHIHMLYTYIHNMCSYIAAKTAMTWVNAITDRLCKTRLALFGWHHQSNATFPIQPHLSYACFAVSRIATLCYIIRYVWRTWDAPLREPENAKGPYWQKRIYIVFYHMFTLLNAICSVCLNITRWSVNITMNIRFCQYALTSPGELCRWKSSTTPEGKRNQGRWVEIDNYCGLQKRRYTKYK